MPIVKGIMNIRIGYLLLLLIISYTGVADANLSLSSSDIYGESRGKDGYHIFVRQKPGCQSILLTESTKDPEMKLAVYALRASTYNPVNGDEKRLLDGKFLKPGHNSIIDSTPEANKRFGMAFHFYIPLVMIYGYPPNRSGKLYPSDGVFINMRCFEKLYADYTGKFQDNPFTLKISTIRPKKPPEEIYNKDALESYKDITGNTKGNMYYAVGNEDLLKKLDEILDKETGESLDLVLAMDTSKSMKDNIPYLKKHIIDILKKPASRFPFYRCGLLLYKDYNEEYLVKPFPFVNDFAILQGYIDKITVGGGRDIPEAVYEALYYSCESYKWEAKNRLVILIGDAPPHPEARGDITPALLYELADSLSIRINIIIYPE
ncbi:MAG: VWA domain-containing protein [Spirochaetales bacterium]|nr:VWA domain-containing protein [Spirochaetales bacterium]